MKISVVCKMLMFASFLGFAIFSGIFVLANDGDTVSKCSEKELAEADSNESSLQEITDFHEKDIILEVNLQNDPINCQDYWNDSETVVIDIKKFKE